MERKIIKTDKAPGAIGPYSQGILVKEGSEILFLSGQIAIVPETGELITNSPEKETEQIMKNLGAVLQAAGMDFKNLVKTTIYLTDLSNFQKVNEVYAKFVGDVLPARATVEISSLPKGVSVEIEAIAMK